MSISGLVDGVSRELSFRLSSSTVRSVLYKHTDIFQKRDDRSKPVSYRLSDAFLLQCRAAGGAASVNTDI